jgi:hypothetical protein
MSLRKRQGEAADRQGALGGLLLTGAVLLAGKSMLSAGYSG